MLHSASIPQRNQHSSYRAFPSKSAHEKSMRTDAADQRRRSDCWMQLLILLRLSHLSPSHWKPRCLYGPVIFVTHSLKASDQGVSLPQPGPDRHNLNSGFAICWVEASSVNAEWRKKQPQRGKAAPYSPVLPSLWSSPYQHHLKPQSTPEEHHLNRVQIFLLFPAAEFPTSFPLFCAV